MFFPRQNTGIVLDMSTAYGPGPLKVMSSRCNSGSVLGQHLLGSGGRR